MLDVIKKLFFHRRAVENFNYRGHPEFWIILGLKEGFLL